MFFRLIENVPVFNILHIDVIIRYTSTLRIEVTMAASTGGYKKVHNTETDKMDDQFFTGQSSSRKVRVTIDLLPPTHCTTTGNCSSEDAAPVGVGREIDNNVSSST